MILTTEEQRALDELVELQIDAAIEERHLHDGDICEICGHEDVSCSA